MSDELSECDSNTFVEHYLQDLQLQDADVQLGLQALKEDKLMKADNSWSIQFNVEDKEDDSVKVILGTKLHLRVPG